MKFTEATKFLRKSGGSEEEGPAVRSTSIQLARKPLPEFSAAQRWTPASFFVCEPVRIVLLLRYAKYAQCSSW
jgi:hypothetical protein